MKTSLAAEGSSISPFDAIRLLRSAGKSLLSQAALHAQLASVEWEEEKTRLLKMLIALLFGFAGALCMMIFAGVLLLAFTWETPYRIPALAALIVLYAAGIAVAWLRLHALSALSVQSFAATRQELTADIELLRSKL